MLRRWSVESSSSPSTTTSSLTWITWFCSLPGHEYFCEVAEVTLFLPLLPLRLMHHPVIRNSSKTTLISPAYPPSYRSTKKRWRWSSTSKRRKNLTRSLTSPSSKVPPNCCTVSFINGSSSPVKDSNPWFVPHYPFRSSSSDDDDDETEN